MPAKPVLVCDEGSAPHMPKCNGSDVCNETYDLTSAASSGILDVPQQRCHGVMCAMMPDMAGIQHPLCYVMGKPVNALT